MAMILRSLPFYEEQTSLRIPGGPAILVKSYQIIVWISVSNVGTRQLPADSRKFPAVLDTGFNGNFLIQESQLVEWARVNPQELTWTNAMIVDGNAIPVRDADVWIHANQPGFRDQFSGWAPFCVELPDGIGIWPKAIPGARRFPLLGVRGLKRADLRVILDCQLCRTWIRTPRRFWFF